MRWIHIVAVGVLLSLAGCSGCNLPEAPTPKPADAPLDENLAMTKQGVLDELRPRLAIMRAALQPGASGISDNNLNALLALFRDARFKYGDREYAREAFEELADDVSDMARQARDQERWRLAMLCVDLHEILGMDSMELDRIGERGRVILAKPKVVVKGFMEDKDSGSIAVFLELTNRETQKTSSKVMREGDEDGNLRLVRIIGDNQSVRFEYTAIPGMFFDIEGVEWRAKS